MKRFLPQYNFLPRVREKDDACYPYLSDEAMENLKWATASYSDVLPGLHAWSRTTDEGRPDPHYRGPFKGVEASVIIQPGGGRKEVMVCVENCMYVPLLCVEPGQYEVIALAVLSVPVFDTFRVMTTRILKRKSPFHPDKTHLHHLFIRLGCSHAATTLAILSLNFFVVLCWWISCMVGCSIDVQLYIVLALSILANLCVFLMNNCSGNETVNAGTGKELTIKALTELVAKVAGYTGEIRWDPSMPNGTPRKLLDVSKAKVLGWTYKTELEDGIRLACKDFLENPMRAER